MCFTFTDKFIIFYNLFHYSPNLYFIPLHYLYWKHAIIWIKIGVFFYFNLRYEHAVFFLYLYGSLQCSQLLLENKIVKKLRFFLFPLISILEWGRIINVSSIFGVTGKTDLAAYVSSKHGLIGLTKVCMHIQITVYRRQ